jgi:glycine cleavage system H protein
MSAKQYDFPDDCRYTRSDEWVRMDGTKARIGITDYAQSELSDIVFVEVREVGTQVEAGESLGVVESVKAVSDLYAPFAGEIVAVHGALTEHPEWINEEPYGRGWILTMVPEDIEALDSLLGPDDYRKYVEERAAK